GRFFSATNGAHTVPVWSTQAPLDLDPRTADMTAEFPGDSPGLIALSPDGSALAGTAGTDIVVAPVRPRGEASRPPIVTLPGNDRTTEVVFAGDREHLLSAD